MWSDMWQALTSFSVCFNMYDFGLDATGLRDAIADFWLNNPAVKAVQPVRSGSPGLLGGWNLSSPVSFFSGPATACLISRLDDNLHVSRL